MNLHNLLVVVDPSSDEQPALTRAQWIAERSGASVELLLCDFNPALDGGLFFDSHSLQRARDLYLDERVTWLEQLSMPLQQAGIRTQVEAQWGKPLDRMVLQRVGETRPDLVLKSTRKHNLLRRLLLGNSDWQLIRHCPQPLWLVHHDAWRGQRLCAALDPLHASDKPAALDHRLIAAARQLEASLGLRADYLHTHAAMPRSLLFDAEMLAGYERFVLQHEERHRQAFDDLLAAYPEIAAERRHLLAGYAEQAIPDFVRANDIDLLLMGAHHQKTFERFGNTTLDQVVRRSRVPVLLAVREADEPYRQALSALDFSQCACTALRQAYRLLPVEADLHALHVFESPDDGVLGLPRQNAAHLATQAGLIEQLLSDEQERLPGVGPQLSHEVVPGVLPYSLDAALKQRQPELLALGRHSRNALMQALLGNLAQRYLRQPSCDVLVTS